MERAAPGPGRAFVHRVRKAVQSNLQTGDVAIFDSRVLHCGLGNTSTKRRILFYCTVSAQHAWPLPDGLHGSNSVLPADRSRWRVQAFSPPLCVYFGGLVGDRSLVVLAMRVPPEEEGRLRKLVRASEPKLPNQLAQHSLLPASNGSGRVFLNASVRSLSRPRTSRGPSGRSGEQERMLVRRRPATEVVRPYDIPSMRGAASRTAQPPMR